MEVKIVTVIGANGTMGTNASAMFASFGNATVYMISRDIQKSRNAIDRAVKSVRAEAIRKNMIPCDYSSIAECIKKSDFVFESVAENLKIKKEITQKIGEYVSDNTIIATGTSGLSINEIANSLPDNLRKNYYGVHFFNPPYSMPLLELIPSKYSDTNQTNELRKYLENQLLRTVVVCKDSPAFIANRVGFQFLNLALQYAEKYKDKGGIAYIESILGVFTGRAMTPCATVDFVGLDVHKAIVDNLLKNTSDYANNSFVLPKYVGKLIDEGRLGKKTGSGLFKNEITEDGNKLKLVYDVSSDRYIEYKKQEFDFSKKMNTYLNNGDYELAFKSLLEDSSEEAKICLFFLKDYVDYSLNTVKQVCEDISMVDDAMATGFNWCPPLVLSNLLFGTNYPSKYDFRSFFKAGK